MARKTALPAVLLIALCTACGSNETATPPSTSEPASTSQPAQTSSAPTTTPPGGSASETAADGTSPQQLTASVGEEGDPDAFVISLTDADGAAVSELPAGDYTIVVDDPSTIHNFHLTGGDVDETTTVAEQTEVSWDVTLTAGEYTFVCDPHPDMVGEFVVS